MSEKVTLVDVDTLPEARICDLESQQLVFGGRPKMPRKSPFLRCLDGYVQYLREEAKLAERSVKDYERAICYCRDVVQDGGGPENPVKVSKENLRYLLDHLPGATSTRKWRWSIYSGFLKWCGNRTISTIRQAWPQVYRTNVDWLEPEQADIVRETAMGMDPLSALIVHLELDLCLRRCEVMRLRMQDIHRDYIDVLGKGRMGGKWRTVKLGSDSGAILNRWLGVRQQLLSLTKGPQTDQLIVYQLEKKLVPYQRSALDYILERVGATSGISFKGHHTLRRTGGRMMWLEGVQIETIANIMGHSSTQTTLLYIGVNLDDQSKALDIVRNARIQRAKIAQNVPLLAVPGV